MGHITADRFPHHRFRLIRTLATTGMSVVHLAADADGRTVVVKVVAPASAGLREAAALSHPNIVPVYSVHLEDDLSYLVMPYVDGPNVRNLLGSGPLTPLWTVHMVRAVAAALDFAHTAGVVHRDVKPSNILVDRHSGRILLCDFGIGHHHVGTPGYVAPELVGEDAAPADPRADVYSLGVVVYECLTGRPPHDYADAAELLWAQGNEDPLAVTAWRPDLPAALNKVLATALAKRPRHRYRTCGDLAEELGKALTGEKR
jgi:serine/threonine protein kinase